MKSLNHYIKEYRYQLEKGDIRIAYRGIMDFMAELKNQLQKKHPDHFISGSLYYGTMDMTFFSFTSPVLYKNKLKTAIVFVHEKAAFEVWLAGVNKSIQKRYWEIIKKTGFTGYRIPTDIKGIDSIVEQDITINPDFDNKVALAEQIEKDVLKFENDIALHLFE